MSSPVPIYDDDFLGEFNKALKRLDRIERSLTLVLNPEIPHVVGSAGEPAFQNGWVNYGSFQVARFWKDGVGMAHIEGLVHRGVSPLTTATVIFVLPEGYRPELALIFAAEAVGAHARVDVYPDGNVWMSAGAPGAGGTGSYLSLSGITFRVDS